GDSRRCGLLVAGEGIRVYDRLTACPSRVGKGSVYCHGQSDEANTDSKFFHRSNLLCVFEMGLEGWTDVFPSMVSVKKETEIRFHQTGLDDRSPSAHQPLIRQGCYPIKITILLMPLAIL